jgi:hypothetical protein
MTASKVGFYATPFDRLAYLSFIAVRVVGISYVYSSKFSVLSILFSILLLSRPLYFSMSTAMVGDAYILPLLVTLRGKREI